jgi:threonine/homoserine/homoserine lactone efflux protein
MIVVYLLEGFAIGFLLAMPVGPIGVLCIRRTLAHGRRHGFVIGLSAAAADIVYAFVAAFGITLISNIVTGFQCWFRIAGGILLLSMGLYIFRSHASVQMTSKRSNVHTKTFLSTFVLALTNPMTLFAFATAITALRSGQAVNDRLSFAMLVAGIFFGSLSWFLLLTSLTSVFKKKITNDGLSVVNRIAGGLLMSFGIAAVWIGLKSL